MTFKNKTLRIVSLLVIFTSGNSIAQQQKYSFSQYSDNLTSVNAAYAVLDNASSFNLLGLKQFIGIDGAPTSLLLNANFPIQNIKGNAGIYVLNDHVAIENQIEVNGFFAKSVQFSDNSYLAVSLNFGVHHYTSNYSRLDASDPLFMTDVRQTQPNVGFGIMFYGDKFYLGLSVPELSFNIPNNGSTLQTNFQRSHYYITGAFLTDFNEDLKFKTATLLSYVKGVPLLANLSGTLYIKEQIGLGFNYRSDKEAAAMFTVLGRALKFCYSYKFGTESNSSGFIVSSHELGIAYRWGNKLQKKFL